MAEYAPTVPDTDTICLAYVQWYFSMGYVEGESDAVHEAEFHLWLAAHDEQVRIEAMRTAAERIAWSIEHMSPTDIGGKQRDAEMTRDHAAWIARQEAGA